MRTFLGLAFATCLAGLAVSGEESVLGLLRFQPQGPSPHFVERSAPMPMQFYPLTMRCQDAMREVQMSLQENFRVSANLKISNWKATDKNSRTLADIAESGEVGMCVGSQSLVSTFELTMYTTIPEDFEGESYEELEAMLKLVHEQYQVEQGTCFQDLVDINQRIDDGTRPLDLLVGDRVAYWMFSHPRSVTLDRVYQFLDALKLKRFDRLKENKTLWTRRAKNWLDILQNIEEEIDHSVAQLNRRAYGLYGKPWDTFPVTEITFDIFATESPTDAIETSKFLLVHDISVHDIKDILSNTTRARCQDDMQGHDFDNVLIRFRGHTFDSGTLAELFETVNYRPEPFGRITMGVYVARKGSSPTWEIENIPGMFD